MKEIVWTHSATADAQEIYQRLDEWEEGMGDRFHMELLAKVELLQTYPKIGPIYFGDSIRRVLVFNRNYGLFYIIEPRGIILHTLQDLRQDPEAILRRLKSFPHSP